MKLATGLGDLWNWFSYAEKTLDVLEKFEKATLSPAEKGTFFHAILEKFAQSLFESGEFKKSVDPDVTAEALFSLMESFALRVLLGVENDVHAARQRFNATISALAV